MAGIGVWIQAARPRTLAAGAVPVAVGTALASTLVAVDWWAAAGCLVGAILIQIGCNFANDAFDALSGADNADRIGPRRAVAAGLVSPRAMLVATAIVLALAFAIGLYLAFGAGGGWGILVLGLISLVCAVGYTAGPFPLAYVGLGDLFVFLFFGLAAVLGSAWVQAGEFIERHAGSFWIINLVPPGPGLAPWHAWHPIAVLNTEDGQIADFLFFTCPVHWWQVAAAVGLQATAIIAVNNLRDIPTDAPAGKRTLAVRKGDAWTRRYYLGLHLAAAALLACVAHRFGGLLWLPVGIALAGGVGCWLGLRRQQGAALNPWLGRTAAVELATGLALTIAIFVR
jgi:1,4-dihydroxy-2-naphthoate octaprenyltransferase